MHSCLLLLLRSKLILFFISHCVQRKSIKNKLTHHLQLLQISKAYIKNYMYLLRALSIISLMIARITNVSLHEREYSTSLKMTFSTQSGLNFGVNDSFVLKVVTISRKPQYKDVYRRTIEMPQRARTFQVNCCLKVHNAHLKLLSSISG